jgi:Fe2+ or Zn2+ uptake regulation protein
MMKTYRVAGGGCVPKHAASHVQILHVLPTGLTGHLTAKDVHRLTVGLTLKTVRNTLGILKRIGEVDTMSYVEDENGRWIATYYRKDEEVLECGVNGRAYRRQRVWS